MRMSTSGHNQRQVSTTVERAICDDLIVDTCVPLRGKKISLRRKIVSISLDLIQAYGLGEDSLELRLLCSASCKVGAQGFDTRRLSRIYGKDNGVATRNTLVWRTTLAHWRQQHTQSNASQ